VLLLKEGHCLKDHVLAACRLRSSETDTSLASTSLYTLVQMVAGHMGTTLVPAMALDQLLSQNPELKAVPLKEKGPHRSIAFIVRPNYSGVGDIQVLMEMIRRELQG
jgi:LysR family hydrogen peroxide-inducible transcriptional activator